MKIVTATCKHCGKNWVPRVPDPARCPGCFKKDWQAPKERVKT